MLSPLYIVRTFLVLFGGNVVLAGEGVSDHGISIQVTGIKNNNAKPDKWLNQRFLIDGIRNLTIMRLQWLRYHHNQFFSLDFKDIIYSESLDREQNKILQMPQVCNTIFITTKLDLFCYYIVFNKMKRKVVKLNEGF